MAQFAGDRFRVTKRLDGAERAVRKVIVEANTSAIFRRVTIRGAGSRLADPPAIGL
jgi:hypothetical protein